MLRAASLLLVGLLALVFAAAARAAAPATYQLDPGGRVQEARAVDLDGDGRLDLVLLVQRRNEAGGTAQELLLLRSPTSPVEGTFFRDEDRTRIPLDTGPAARAGVLAIGRFGPKGEVRIRLIAADGIHDLDAQGRPLPRSRRRNPKTLFARSPGRPIVIWDGHTDLDGDGVEECWFPIADRGGRIYVYSEDARADRVLELPIPNRAAADEQNLFLRYARVPRLVAIDIDGDRRRELVARDGPRLMAWRTAGPAASSAAPFLELRLPFEKSDLGPDEIHTPRLQLADVDGDGKADLLVTLVTGDRTQLGSFRTRLLHFPGPFVDAESGELVPPRIRIDTESVGLHPRFLDLDGDGALDYVSDSIRGSKLDLIKRVLGQEPTIWHVAFRFDREEGTFERQPYFDLERPYSREEAVSNRFSVSGFFSGDFDGDGHKDLLDLGNLSGLTILGATPGERDGGDGPVAFTKRIFPRVRVKPPLSSNAVVADLTGNGLADAVLWNETSVLIVAPRREP